jgi:hypothetical protein
VACIKQHQRPRPLFYSGWQPSCMPSPADIWRYGRPLSPPSGDHLLHQRLPPPVSKLPAPLSCRLDALPQGTTDWFYYSGFSFPLGGSRALFPLKLVACIAKQRSVCGCPRISTPAFAGTAAPSTRGSGCRSCYALLVLSSSTPTLPRGGDTAPRRMPNRL